MYTIPLPVRTQGKQTYISGEEKKKQAVGSNWPKIFGSLIQQDFETENNLITAGEAQVV